jgi:hypothetical protein
VTGELPAGSTGYGVVEIHWRHGLLRYTTEVVQVRGRGRGTAAQAASDHAPVLHASPSSRLMALRPGMQVTRDQARSSGGSLFGWQVPVGVAAAALLLSLCGLGLLVAGPEPWRATGGPGSGCWRRRSSASCSPCCPDRPPVSPVRGTRDGG